MTTQWSLISAVGIICFTALMITTILTQNRK